MTTTSEQNSGGGDCVRGAHVLPAVRARACVSVCIVLVCRGLVCLVLSPAGRKASACVFVCFGRLHARI
jgi:hypothetical protein